jgi:hypothetical protein
MFDLLALSNWQLLDWEHLPESVMDNQTARHLLNLEGRVAALSGIVAQLIWALRQGQALDPELERQIYAQASEAAGGLPAELESGADRLILALQASAGIIRSSVS